MAEFEPLPEDYDLSKRIASTRTQQAQKEVEGYEPLPAGYRLPGTEVPAYEKDWANAPMGEVAASAAKEFIPSVWRGVKAIPEAIMNPSETASGLKQAATGVASKVKGAFGEVKAPEQKAEDEAVINAMIEPFTSVAGFKKALATDPFSVLSVASIPVSGGAGLLGKGAQAVGTASTAAKAAYYPLKVGEALGKTAAGVMDPISGAVGVAGKAYDIAGKPALKSIASSSSGVPKASLELAYESGKTADPVVANAFNKFAKGEGDAVEFSRAVGGASEKLRNAEISNWASDKANVLALKQNVPPGPILSAIQEARTIAGNPSLGIGPAKAANQQIDQLEKLLQNRFSLPAGSPGRTLEGFDLLKRELYEMGESSSGMQSQVITKINSGVRKAMGDVSGEYVNLMEKYQTLNDKMKTIQKTLATGDNVSAVRELNTFIRGMDDATKNQFITELAKYDKRIPFMVAGASINQAAGSPSNWAQALKYGQMANVGWALKNAMETGNYLHLLGATSTYGAQKVFGSPSAVSDIAQASGKLAKTVEKIPEGVAPVAEGARRIGTSELSRTQNEELMDQYRPLTIQGPGNRQQRKSGGRVSDKLVTMVDRARKNINNQTESLLGTHDNHVAQALEIANRNLED